MINKKHKHLAALFLTTAISFITCGGFGQTYVTNNQAGTKQEFTWPEGKKMAVLNGLDIGNHSLYHPCSGNFAWSRSKALEEYSLQMMMDELDSATRLIKETLGVNPVSFAYPCAQTFIGRGINVQSYVPLIAFLFESGRGWLNEAPNNPEFCDLSQLNGTELDGKSFEQVMKLIETAKANGHGINQSYFNRRTAAKCFWRQSFKKLFDHIV
jgi:hypothetical protein